MDTQAPQKKTRATKPKLNALRTNMGHNAAQAHADNQTATEASMLEHLVLEQHGSPLQALVAANTQHTTRLAHDKFEVTSRATSSSTDKHIDTRVRHAKYADILAPSPELDYSLFSDASTPHVIPKGYTIAYKTYQRWEQDLVAQGGVARFLNASEDQIDGSMPMPDGTTRTYGPGVAPFKMNLAVWKANALIPARLATLAHRFGLPDGEAWVLEMIFTGATYTQIASILGMRTTVFLGFLLDNVDPVKLKAVKQNKTAALLDMAEDAAISVLALPEEATPADVEMAEARARAISSITGITKFVASARLPEFSAVKSVGLGQTAQINISFNPED